MRIWMRSLMGVARPEGPPGGRPQRWARVGVGVLGDGRAGRRGLRRRHGEGAAAAGRVFGGFPPLQKALGGAAGASLLGWGPDEAGARGGGPHRNPTRPEETPGQRTDGCSGLIRDSCRSGKGRRRYESPPGVNHLKRIPANFVLQSSSAPSTPFAPPSKPLSARAGRRRRREPGGREIEGGPAPSRGFGARWSSRSAPERRRPRDPPGPGPGRDDLLHAGVPSVQDRRSHRWRRRPASRR